MGFSLDKAQSDQGKHSEAWKKEEASMALGNTHLQALLARAEYPDSDNPMLDWVSEERDGFTMADRFGGYRVRRGEETTVDVGNEEKIRHLLLKIRMQAPDELGKKSKGAAPEPPTVH